MQQNLASTLKELFFIWIILTIISIIIINFNHIRLKGSFEMPLFKTAIYSTVQYMNCLTLLLWKSARNIFYIKGIFIKKMVGGFCPSHFFNECMKSRALKDWSFFRINLEPSSPCYQTLVVQFMFLLCSTVLYIQ